MQVFLWVLYDFANSFFSAAVEGLYFSQWVVIDNKFPDIWYGATYSIATLLLLVTGPILGYWSDLIGKKLPFLKIATMIVVLLGILLGIITSSHIPQFTKVILALVLFLFIQYFYQAAAIFYNPLLQQISNNKNRGFISGLGQLANNLGYVIATGLFLLIVKNGLTFAGQPGRNQVFIPAALLFGILVVPIFTKFKEKQIAKPSQKIMFRKLIAISISGLKNLFSKEKNIGNFLFAFMLISDAILTANLFFAIFLEQVYGLPDSQKFVLISLLTITAIPSCYILGKLGDKFGLKKVLLLSCLILIVSFLAIGLSASAQIIYPLAIFTGLGWGGYYATARALLINISPKNKLGEYFGYYSTFQKFASIIGPLIWGGIVLLLENYGVVKYRVALLALIVLMAIGTIFLTKVSEKRYLKIGILHS